ncbi:MAG: ABC transporter ATP-binding protein [Selenomonadaceae bacterium]|nr:ABC transporter ATP-binding protein [Selenomonadaceae bacterium]MDD7056308.1 ABC transporter ATP-binding protein [Selenomonadaceae bacterium]MDY3916740.1 ABC transporter ATP-binding protein [Selenomonadaceae bacterium]
MWSIDFEDVGMTFGARTIFSGITHRIEGGRITAVIGQNGSGKSTCLRLAGHLLRPTQGTVIVQRDGETLRQGALRQEIGMVTPELRFYPRLTARENMTFLLGLRGKQLDEQAYQQVLRQVGLETEAVAHTMTGEFSTGMRQRLKLAVLFLVDAHIWLLDEPGANLDAAGRSMVLQAAREAAQAGRLVLLATNDPGEEEVADDIIHL